MSAASAYCRLVLGDPVAAASAAEAAAAATSPRATRVEEIASAWRACQPELERRRDVLAWEDVPGAPSLSEGLAALGDRERGAVAAQAFGLEPGEVEHALGVGPDAARGMILRAHVRLARLGPAAGAGCAEARERVATAPTGTGTEHCADCRAFAAAVSEQRLALRRAAGAEEPAPSGGRGAKPSAGPPASAVAWVRSAASAARRPGAAASVFARVRSAASAARRPGAAAPAVARVRSAASAAAVTLGPVIEPKERGPRIAVALAVLLLAGLVGFGVVSAFETPREGGDDPGVVTATPVGPLPPGAKRAKP
jgi:hypothetical protein